MSAAKKEALDAYRACMPKCSDRADSLGSDWRTGFATWLNEVLCYDIEALIGWIEKPWKYDAEFRRYLLWEHMPEKLRDDGFKCECGEMLDWSDRRCSECGGSVDAQVY